MKMIIKDTINFTILVLSFLKRENRGYISCGKILVFGQKGGVFQPEIPGIGGVFQNLRHDVYPPIIPSGGAGLLPRQDLPLLTRQPYGTPVTPTALTLVTPKALTLTSTAVTLLPQQP